MVSKVNKPRLSTHSRYILDIDLNSRHPHGTVGYSGDLWHNCLKQGVIILIETGRFLKLFKVSLFIRSDMGCALRLNGLC